MFSELIPPGESFDLDNTAVPSAENNSFGFAKWRSLWWRLCGHRGHKHCSVQLGIYFLGPSSNTESHSLVYKLGLETQGLCSITFTDALLLGQNWWKTRLLEAMLEVVVFVKCLAPQGFEGSLLLVASEGRVGQGGGCQHSFPLCPSAGETAARPVLKHSFVILSFPWP